MIDVPAGGGRIAARHVLLDTEHTLAPGEIVWDRSGRIVALRRARRGPIADVAVLPGLVDAHAHLQLPALPDAPTAFVPWLRSVMASRMACAAPQERAIVRTALADLLADGTTAVGDIDATGIAGALLAASPLRARSYRELTGFHLDAAAARALVRERLPRGSASTGLSPHAPYSVSPALLRAAAAAARHLAIHCAEVPEEQQFLRTGRGPFRDLLEALGRLPAGFRAPGVGAVAWLAQHGVLRRTTQLVHCQELVRGDAARIAAAGASIAVCPGTIAFFGRQPPPVPQWLARGIVVALGTDSRASNRGLSMRAELALAAKWWPALPPAALLAMATSGGARSLGLPGAGCLRLRGRADFVVVPAAASREAALTAFVHGASTTLRVVCAGRTVRRRAGR